MSQLRAFAVLALVTATGVAPVFAQGKSGNAPRGGAPKMAAPAPKGHATTSTGTSTQTAGQGGGAAKHETRTEVGKGVAASGKSKQVLATTTAVQPARNLIAARITSNPDQMARVQAMLPAGMTVDQATAGFRNQAQFIAALNASKNRGVKFVDLQKAMTVDGLSLGQAVRQIQAAPAVPPETGTTTPTTTPTTPTTQPGS
jgi:hypothetical protein